jgi:serine/threonine protein kinase
LGKGTFGKVVLAHHIPTGLQVAIKILRKAKIAKYGDHDRVRNEINVLKRLRHQSICKLIEIFETD